MLSQIQTTVMVRIALMLSFIQSTISQCNMINFGSLSVWIYDDNIIRVTHTPDDAMSNKFPTCNSSLVVNYNTNSNVSYNITKSHNDKNIYYINTNSLSLKINNNTKFVEFIDIASNQTILTETQFEFDKYIDTLTNQPMFTASTTWKLSNRSRNNTDIVDEALYGFGEYQNGYLNYRDVPIQCIQFNTQACIPFIISNRNYGILWDNYGVNVWNSQNNSEIILTLNNNQTDENDKISLGYSGSYKFTIDNLKLENHSCTVYGDCNFGFLLSLADIFSWTLTDSGMTTYAFIIVRVGYSYYNSTSLTQEKISVDINVIEWFEWATIPSSLTGKLTIPGNIMSTIVDNTFYVNVTIGNQETSRFEQNVPRLYIREPSYYTDIKSLAAYYIDYYFVYANDYIYSGPSKLDQVIGLMRRLTGQVAMYSLWSYGFIQSRNRYMNQSHLLYYATQFRDKGLPIDCIVQDWDYWGDLGWSPVWDPTLYPNPQEMIDTLHGMNIKIMVSIWGKFENTTSYYQTLKSKGYLFAPKGGYAWFNVYMPQARDLFYNWANETMYSIGVDATWLDGSEPTKSPQRNISFKFGLNNYNTSGKYLYNPFSMYITSSIWDNWMKYHDKQNTFILTRSSFLHQSTHGATLWSGDISCDWNVLYKQIIASLNYHLSGMPYWTNDVGGFFRNNNLLENDEYKRLLIRWFQFGVFIPILRTHGTGTTEYFEYGPIVTKYVRLIVDLRYRLLPYIYSMAYRVTKESFTIQRALVFDFANDRDIYATISSSSSFCNYSLNSNNMKNSNGFSKCMSSQSLFNHIYMFGDSLLIAPVFKDTNQTNVYLSYLVAKWYDFWNGTSYTTRNNYNYNYSHDNVMMMSDGQGIQWLNMTVDLSIVPIYVKGGSIIILGPFVEYSNQIPWIECEVRIYSGDDASFVMYEDDQVSAYNIERNQYTTIKFDWFDHNSTLVIGAREGYFDAMINQARIFNLVLVKENHGVGVNATEVVDSVVSYFGNKTTIQF